MPKMSVDAGLLDEVRRRMGWSWLVLARFVARGQSTVRRWRQTNRLPSPVARKLTDLLTALETGVIPAWLDPLGSGRDYIKGNAFRRGEKAWRKSVGLDETGARVRE